MKTKKYQSILLLTLCTILLFTFTGCSNPKPETSTKAEPTKRTEYLLGTICEITIYDKVDTKVFDDAFAAISRIEKEMTINNAQTSEIMKVNEASGKEAVKISPDTFFVVEKGLYYSKLTGGAFDITVGPLVKLWNIGTDLAAVPPQDKITDAMNHIDYTKLVLDKNNFTAKLEGPDMKIDLGAIAKGYAADATAKVLKDNGVKHAIVNLGGNILVIGSKVNGDLWNIGVQDPFSTRGEYIGIMKMQDEAIVSSGTYERYFEENGKIYHHILDPKTGFPAENNLVGVSIVAKASIDGDGLSTSTFLLGEEKGMELIESLEGVEAVFITKDKKVYVSSGLKDNFTITNGEFQLAN